jgi:hypothetical protein
MMLGTEEWTMTPDVTDLLNRSSTEAVRAIEATDPADAARHQELCLHYTGRAMAALIAGRVAFPFQRAA